MTILYDRLPTIDLHGEDRDTARILINDFVNDNIRMKNKEIVIIHGDGQGILRKTTQETLRLNRKVEEYKIANFNAGMTIVKLKI